jgi:hypothetical protein
VDDKLLDGPWDLTVMDSGVFAQIFVSNVLSGAVTRIDLVTDRVRGVFTKQMVQIASGYAHRCDPAALVVGPTGLALDQDSGTLYVASTGDNEIFKVPNATTTMSDNGQGQLFIKNDTVLHGPLGLVRVPNGDLISAQGDAVNPDPAHPSEIVEFDPAGNVISEFSIDPGAGSAFGLALSSGADGFVFAAVDDGTNMLDVWVVH